MRCGELGDQQSHVGSGPFLRGLWVPYGAAQLPGDPMAEGPLGRSVAWGHSSIQTATGPHSHRAAQEFGDICSDGRCGSSLMLWS